jgi:hypothetical protein
MRTLSPGRRNRRPRSIRTLAIGSAVLAGLAVGGNAVKATSADAATLSADNTCGIASYWVPSGAFVLLTEPSSGVQYMVLATAGVNSSGPVGYVVSAYDTSGQVWETSTSSWLSTSSLTMINDFGVFMAYDSQLDRYLPALTLDTCTWTAELMSESYTTPYIGTSETTSGTNMAGFFAGENQAESIDDSATSDDTGDDDFSMPISEGNDYSDAGGGDDDSGD